MWLASACLYNPRLPLLDRPWAIAALALLRIMHSSHGGVGGVVCVTRFISRAAARAAQNPRVDGQPLSDITREGMKFCDGPLLVQ